MMTLSEIIIALDGSLDWQVSSNGLTVAFFASGTKISDDKVEAKLEAHDIDITVKKLRELILKQHAATQSDGPGEICFLPLPPRESCTEEDDVTEWDEVIWQDVKFVDGDNSVFYVKDSETFNTYSAYLTGVSTSDNSDAKILREAFYQHTTNKPEQIVKTLIKDFKLDETFDTNTMYTLPVSAWDYIKIKAERRDKTTIRKKLVVPAGSAMDLYKGFIKLEGDFRSKESHRLSAIKNLTNDPDEPAIAFIDLDALDHTFKNQHSNLWDKFLSERLHDDAYVSIFKAWVYAVAVGKNNSRQEMWLYGNGGTGKSVMCKALITGFNKLAGKNICLAASKDSGKSNFNSEFLNKHFMVYSDAKNLKSGMSEAKHNITGGDYMRIEGKGKEAISAKIYMKCLSCSNELPKCDMTDRSQSSRFIVLPFSLSDDEMKSMGLMRSDGSIIGSATFEDELAAEFPRFLASCKLHYMKRCETDSDIDAHEANKYLESINLDSIEDVEEFISTFFEITKNPKDRITCKEFRKQYLLGVDSMDDDGIKMFAHIESSDLRTYLEKKYGFRTASVRIAGTVCKAIVSSNFGIKIKSTTQQIEYQSITTDDCEF